MASCIIKKKSRKKAGHEKYNELSFVQNHVDTFYVGLNENKSARNPIQAQVIDLNGDDAGDIVRHWVEPDTELVKSATKLSSKRSKLYRSNSETYNNKENTLNKTKHKKGFYKPLKFINEIENDNEKQVENKNKSSEFDIDKDHLQDNSLNDTKSGVPIVKNPLIDENDLNKSTNVWDRLCSNETTVEPSSPIKDNKSYKVFVNDTPVQYYGLSVIERRKRGLDF